MRVGQESVRASRESQRATKITKNVRLIKTQLITITNKSKSKLSHVSMYPHSKHCTASLSVTNFNKQVINHRILKL